MPRITISYRRDDSEVITGRIFDRLVARYGRDAVFRDIDNIPIGVDFRTHVDQVLRASAVVIAIVGPQWLGPQPSHNRLRNEADPVRVEIEAALRKRLPIIPVLVLRSSMPSVSDLPESLEEFAYRNAVQIDAGQDFDVHMARLIRALDAILGTPDESVSAAHNRASSPDRAYRITAIAAGLLLLALSGGVALHFGLYREDGAASSSPVADPELLLWKSTLNSGTIADFEEYLMKFPDGRFVEPARDRIASLKAAARANLNVPSANLPNVNTLSVQFENNAVAASAAYSSAKPVLFDFEHLDISDSRIVATKTVRPNYTIKCLFPLDELEKLKPYAVGEQIPVSMKLRSYEDRSGIQIVFDCAFDQQTFESMRFDLSEKAISDCLDKPDRQCMSVVLKAAGTTDFSNVFAGGCTVFRSVRSDRAGAAWRDIWTTSIYSYAQGASIPGGGREDGNLKVGGWGDWYYSLIRFEVSPRRQDVKQAFLVLYSLRTGGTAVAMYVDRIANEWSWVSGDRLWWKDRPEAVPWATSPAPRRNAWYPIDITGMYLDWSEEKYRNYGLQLRPLQNNNNNNNLFISSRGGEKAKRPRLIVCQ